MCDDLIFILRLIGACFLYIKIYSFVIKVLGIYIVPW
jgi:hypothetical protein